MKMRRQMLSVMCTAAIAAFAGTAPHVPVKSPPSTPGLSAVAALGEQLSRDESLSVSGRLACQTCHRPEFAHAAAPAQRRAGAVRVPTPAQLRPPPDPMDQTPGPETLASVLEPTPGPEALPPEALSATLEPPPTRSVAVRVHRPKKGRNFLIGAAIGILLLGAIVVLAKKNAPTPPPAPAPTQAP